MGQVTDLRGRTFGQLTVARNAQYTMRGEGQHKYAYWPCKCTCGNTIEVRGKNLLAWEKTDRAISCGCARANPVIRQAARLKTPAKIRRQIASMGAAAAHKKDPS